MSYVDASSITISNMGSMGGGTGGFGGGMPNMGDRGNFNRDWSSSSSRMSSSEKAAPVVDDQSLEIDSPQMQDSFWNQDFNLEESFGEEALAEVESMPAFSGSGMPANFDASQMQMSFSGAPDFASMQAQGFDPSMAFGGGTGMGASGSFPSSSSGRSMPSNFDTSQMQMSFSGAPDFESMQAQGFNPSQMQMSFGGASSFDSMLGGGAMPSEAGSNAMPTGRRSMPSQAMGQANGMNIEFSSDQSSVGMPASFENSQTQNLDEFGSTGMVANTQEGLMSLASEPDSENATLPEVGSERIEQTSSADRMSSRSSGMIPASMESRAGRDVPSPSFGFNGVSASYSSKDAWIWLAVSGGLLIVALIIAKLYRR